MTTFLSNKNLLAKTHNGLDEIIRMLVPLRNEGEQLKNVGNREISWYVT